MKKGFTLIELLAVIVILAIIALIATPIILGIIKDARDSANQRSAELYLEAVKLSVVRYNLNGGVTANNLTCIVSSNGTLTCNGTEMEVDVTQKATGGTITFTGGMITAVEDLAIGERTYELSNGVLVATGTNNSGGNTSGITITRVTTRIPYGGWQVGDEYLINIGGENRTFFILGENASDSTKVDLIMNQNLGSTVAWSSDGSNHKDDSVDQQAVTAKAYLASLTSNWEVTPYIPTKAQIEAAYTGSMPIWLYDYLYNTMHNVLAEVYGYWTVSPDISGYDSAWYVGNSGSIASNHVDSSNSYGVRPVITIPKAWLN